MSTRFAGKVALITGGGTGIGRAAAEALLDGGAKVVVVGRREAPLKALADERGDAVAYALADVGKPDGGASAVRFAIERFGRLDILVNNAAQHVMKPLAESDFEEIASLFAVNVVGVLDTTRAAIPALIASKGNVVNVSSIVSRSVVAGYSAYSPSKAAIDQITRVLAKELGASGVRVNAVAPGLTVTAMARPIIDNAPEFVAGLVKETPLGRLGEPSDIARTIAFLASEEAGWVTGQIVQSSGGALL